MFDKIKIKNVVYLLLKCTQRFIEVFSICLDAYDQIAIIRQ